MSPIHTAWCNRILAWGLILRLQAIQANPFLPTAVRLQLDDTLDLVLDGKLNAWNPVVKA